MAESALLLNLRKTGETSAEAGIFSYPLAAPGPDPDPWHVPSGPLSTEFAAIPGYTNHRPLQVQFMEPLDQDTIIFQQTWAALCASPHTNVVVAEFCRLSNFTTSTLLTSTLRYHFTHLLTRYNAQTRKVRLIRQGQIQDLSVDDGQLTIIAAVPADFRIYDISPDHRYLLGSSKGTRMDREYCTVELYEIDTGVSMVLKQWDEKVEE